MLNPLTPAEMVMAIGRAARDGARGEDPGGAFAQSQLLSAYSASRHLAVELSCFGPEVQVFSDTVAAAVRRGAGDLAGGPALVALAQTIAATTDPQRLGDPVCELLAALRDDGSGAAAVLRQEIRSALAQLADREVALLADTIESAAA